MISGGEQWLESVDTDLTVAVISYCMDSPIHGWFFSSIYMNYL